MHLPQVSQASSRQSRLFAAVDGSERSSPAGARFARPSIQRRGDRRGHKAALACQSENVPEETEHGHAIGTNERDHERCVEHGMETAELEKKDGYG